MGNKYSVKISNSFNVMLYKNLFKYTFYSTSYVNLIHAKVYYFFELLKTFPFSFPKFYLNETNTHLRKYVIDKRFLIVYEVTDNIVEILYFVDGRRSAENILTY